MATNGIQKAGNGTGKALAMPKDFAAKLASGIAESRAQTRITAGVPFLRLLKSGEWLYGAEDTAVEDGSRWVVNLMTLAHGYCCWVDGGNKNTLEGEIMVPMTEEKPPKPDPIAGTPYAEQRGFALKCISGEDTGVEVLYKTASVGGMRAVDGLLQEIQKQVVNDPEHAFPILELDMDSYNHTKWGKTYVPVFKIVGWADINGNEGASEALEAPEPAPEPRVKGRTPRRPQAAAAAPETAPEPAQAARRRPGR